MMDVVVFHREFVAAAHDYPALDVVPYLQLPDPRKRPILGIDALDPLGGPDFHVASRHAAAQVHEEFLLLEIVIPALATVVFGTSRDTSDFVADCLELSRTQFMKRLVEFSDRHQLTLELAYYPPYHSKYNPIERCWRILEDRWNGTLLTSVKTALEWAKTMTWRGVGPLVHLLDRVYETGVRLSPCLFRPIAARLERSASLPKWSLVVHPEPG
jgi:hypothetical protein